MEYPTTPHPALNLHARGANVHFCSFPPRDPDSKKIKNYWYRLEKEEPLKIQLRECNRTQQEEEGSKEQENRTGCGHCGGVRYLRVLDTVG